MPRLPQQHQMLAARFLSSEVHFGPSHDRLQEIMDRNLVRHEAV